MKFSLGRVFDSGQALQALQKSGVNGMEDFLNYMQEFCTQIVNGVRGTLTIEDNLNSLVREVELRHNVRLSIQLPQRNKVPKHLIPTRALPIENAPLSFGWQMLQDGNLELLASFNGAPTTPVKMTVIILF